MLTTLDIDKLISGEINTVINTTGFLGQTKFPKPSFDQFIAARSRTPEQFRDEFKDLQISDAQSLTQSLSSDRFIADTFPFRKYPLCQIGADTHACLDSTFFSELVISGVYWQILDRLPKKEGDAFLTLWGRLLELHLIEMMQFYYPGGLSPLRTDVPYADGQIDFLLDFGPDVVLFEVKGSLLKSAAKYFRDRKAFEQDFSVKFVENEKGDPKALRQLAKASIAAINGQLPLAMKPERVFPVLIGYEPSLDSFWMNRYADNIFGTFLDSTLRPRVRPVTLMSAEALEGAVPYTAAGDISFPDLLDLRFFDGQTKVVDYSVYQAIYDWRVARGEAIKRNEFMLSTFSEVFKKALKKYKGEDI